MHAPFNRSVCIFSVVRFCKGNLRDIATVDRQIDESEALNLNTFFSGVHCRESEQKLVKLNFVGFCVSRRVILFLDICGRTPSVPSSLTILPSSIDVVM